MGQTRALLYKYWLLTKRTKMAFCCQIFSPVMGLLLIVLVLSQKSEFVASQKGLFGSDVLPSSLYISNMITPRWADIWEGLFSIENPVRIKRYAPLTEDINTLFQSWIRTQSNTMSYDNMEDDGTSMTYPVWERFEGKTA